jgi:uncharacterized protein YjbI with pentapeptide repeats
MVPGGQSWESSEKLLLIDRLLSALREGSRTVEPGGSIPGDPVQLQGLEFPTVTLCQQLALPNVVVSRISGRQKIEQATLRRVDLSNANIAFSVWSECVFQSVRFDGASLANGRFLGCTFEDCTFAGTRLADSGITVSTQGKESSFARCCFEKTNLSSATIMKATFSEIEFKSCSMSGVRFDECRLDKVKFTGSYPEVTLRGASGDPSRNKVQIDLSDAKVVYLDADDGVDLSGVIPPKDGSLLLFRDRLRTMGTIFARLGSEIPAARKIADHLSSTFSPSGISPMSADQSTYAVSMKRIAKLDKELPEELVHQIHARLMRIAREEHSLIENTSGH